MKFLLMFRQELNEYFIKINAMITKPAHTFTSFFLAGSFLFLLICHTSFSQNTIQNGIVFEDINRNSRLDNNEKGLANILVSSLDTIVQSNLSGWFSIPVKENDIISVIKPAEYEFELKENNVPDFYYLRYTKGSPEYFKYKGIDANRAVPDTLFFPLHKTAKKKNYIVNLIGDIQTPTKKHIEYFRKGVLPDLLKTNADFHACLGDIADNDLSLYPEIESSLSTLQGPVYMVAGNHDVNYLSVDSLTQVETFRKHFGPDYYSFNYGSTHFIVLNTVDYDGWNSSENCQGGYTGGIHTSQAKWLKQDLSFVSKNSRVVIMAHIPLFPGYFQPSRLLSAYDLLENQNNILGIYGHLHTCANWEYTKAIAQWPYSGKFRGLVAGATSGSWYTSPFNSDSIPEAVCSDGSPSGFYVLDFSDSDYKRSFIPAGKSKDFQLRVSVPDVKVSFDSLPNTEIVVNVFDGEEKTLVLCEFDNYPADTMKYFYGQDPYMVRNNFKRLTYDGWNPPLTTSTHLWKSGIPADIKRGTHTLKITAFLSNGEKHTTYKVFEIY
ncbi:MAG: calcineurin-like phosphoesterase family protein [Bacteroidales bacterium]|nr:calcineurin-like phosphoesterase family protein [Bacteroidales bacterium]MBN2819223.1 calcineurin-like phosphoesterase family protein [Bacteroidales bacterium]